MKNDKKIKKKTLVAFDIGTSYIKIVVGKSTGQKINVKQTITIDTPDLCVSNGRIRDVEILREELKKVVVKYKLKNNYAVITIKSSGIINREMNLPYNEDKDSVIVLLTLK